MAFPPGGELLIYHTEDGGTRVECRFQEDTLWLSQALIAELFQKDVRTINGHLQNIYAEEEMVPGATIPKFRIVRRAGNREVGRLIEHYSLDAILAVGYRVRSPRGTRFRRWATEGLREYLIRAFTMAPTTGNPLASRLERSHPHEHPRLARADLLRKTPTID
jgi:hypothetical protein